MQIVGVGFKEACRPLPVCVLIEGPKCRPVSLRWEVGGPITAPPKGSTRSGKLRDEPFRIRDIHLNHPDIGILTAPAREILGKFLMFISIFPHCRNK
jgi:hypothetical protein